MHSTIDFVEDARAAWPRVTESALNHELHNTPPRHTWLSLLVLPVDLPSDPPTTTLSMDHCTRCCRGNLPSDGLQFLPELSLKLLTFGTATKTDVALTKHSLRYGPRDSDPATKALVSLRPPTSAVRPISQSRLRHMEPPPSCRKSAVLQHPGGGQLLMSLCFSPPDRSPTVKLPKAT